jgi:hypothetical protein
MVFIIFLVSVTVLAALTLAAPSQVKLAPQATCTIWPTSLQYICEEEPNTAFPNNPDIFLVQQRYNASG